MEPKIIYNPTNDCKKLNGYPCWDGEKCKTCIEYFVQLDKYKQSKFKEEYIIPQNKENEIKCIADQIRNEKL